MATKKQKLNFNKFFPESTTFVVLEGYAKGSDDYDVTLRLGDGSNNVTLFTTDWYKDGNAVLKALKDAVDKAIEFQEMATKMGKVESVSLIDILSKRPKKETNKKAATKK